MEGLKNITSDIAVKVSLSFATTIAVGSAIILPGQKQKDSAAFDLYAKPYRELLPNEQKAADFAAGYKRWNGFVENGIYSWTRKLPGHDSPIVNPYKGPRARRQTQKEQKLDETQQALQGEEEP